METKVCKRCLEIKDTNEFALITASRNQSRRGTCRACINLSVKQREDSKRKIEAIDEIPGEKWEIIQIPKLRGTYAISNMGRVKSMYRTVVASNGIPQRKFEKILNPHKNSSGYYYVVFYVDGKQKNNLVHRLVGEYSIENPDKKPFINHKDCNKLNNVYSNIEWCTASENMRHAYANNLINFQTGEECVRTKLKKSDILAIREAGDNILNSVLAETFSTSVSNISHIKRRKSWKQIL